MHRNEAKKVILNKIVSMQGCKATELAAGVEMIDVFREFELTELITQMVNEGMLVELEYELQSVPNRLKSFLLPGMKYGTVSVTFCGESTHKCSG